MRLIKPLEGSFRRAHRAAPPKICGDARARPAPWRERHRKKATCFDLFDPSRGAATAAHRLVRRGSRTASRRRERRASGFGPKSDVPVGPHRAAEGPRSRIFQRTVEGFASKMRQCRSLNLLPICSMRKQIRVPIDRRVDLPPRQGTPPEGRNPLVGYRVRDVWLIRSCVARGMGGHASAIKCRSGDHALQNRI
jgi:hypothetical protein